MNMRDVQMLLAANGDYKGGLDGIIGEAHTAAVDGLLTRRADMLPSVAADWPPARRSIAAAQIVLSFAGFEPGTIDGLAGHNTAEAFNAWAYKRLNGRRETVTQPVLKTAPAVGGPFPHQSKVAAFYGTPGPGGTVEQQLVRIGPGYDCVLDWDTANPVRAITLHQKCARSYELIMADVLAHYGQQTINALGLHRFAGSYNPRRMRGGRAWSMHAYGCAVDWYAAPNGLRTPCPQALFCKPEYKAFLDIHQDHGWTPAIRAWGKDAMHFQAAGWG